MKTYVFIFAEKSGDFVAVDHVSVVRCRSYDVALQDAKSCLIFGSCEGHYVGKRCVVWCIEDHAMWELVCKSDVFVEVYC